MSEGLAEPSARTRRCPRPAGGSGSGRERPGPRARTGPSPPAPFPRRAPPSRRTGGHRPWKSQVRPPGRPRACESCWSKTRPIVPRAWRWCSAATGTRFGWPPTAPPPWTRPEPSRPTWCSWTSACRAAGTATTSHAATDPLPVPKRMSVPTPTQQTMVCTFSGLWAPVTTPRFAV
jgi:hypothetical protein